MGFGNYIKRKSGAYKLPESRLNKSEVYTILKRRMPFIVTLPIVETVRNGVSSSISRTHGNYRQTYYTPAGRKKVFRTVDTNIICEPTRIVIQHAKKNGEHMFVKYSDISTVAKLYNGKINNGVLIELKNGKQYQFTFAKHHKQAWEALGFNPEFPIDVFYRFLLGEWQIVFSENIINRDEIINETSDHSAPKKGKKNKNSSKTTKKNSNINPMQKIKEAKELLDIGAISQEEFDEIKAKYLKDA